MLERTYKDMNEKLMPSPELNAATLARMEEAREKRAYYRRPVRKALTAALAVALVFALGVTAAAAGFPGFREWLFGPASGVADVLTPVKAAGSKDGLEMEVLGAAGDANNVYVYFTLCDTENKVNLSKDTLVFAAAKLNGEYPEREDVLEYGMERETERISFDESTRTALCRFHMKTGKMSWVEFKDGWPYEVVSEENYDATGAEVRLRVAKLINYPDKFDAPIDLTECAATVETVPVTAAHLNLAYSAGDFELTTNDEGIVSLEEAAELYSYFNDSYKLYADENGAPVILKPGAGVTVGDRDYARITAVGFIDGKLRVQYVDYGYFQNEPDQPALSIYCADKGSPVGDRNYKLAGKGWNTFSINSDGEAVIDGAAAIADRNRDYYSEVVFDIGPDELEDYDFYFGGNLHTDMSVNFTADTFMMEGVTPEELLEKLTNK